MGARVLVLAFADEKAAEKCARLLDNFESNPEGETTPDEASNQVLMIGALVAAQSKMEAMVARPTVFCRCVKQGVRGKNQFGGGYTKTIKFGWFVHAECRKPSYPIVANYIKNMIMAAGNDLLPALRDQFRKERNEALALGGQVDTTDTGQLGESAAVALESSAAPVPTDAAESTSQEPTESGHDVLRRDDSGGLPKVQQADESPMEDGTDGDAPEWPS